MRDQRTSSYASDVSSQLLVARAGAKCQRFRRSWSPMMEQFGPKQMFDVRLKFVPEIAFGES